MEYQNDQYHFDPNARYVEYRDPVPDVPAIKSPTERILARIGGRAVAEAVQRGYGPTNVRMTNSQETRFQTEQQGIPAHLACASCGPSPVPYERPQRSRDIDQRLLDMDKSWEEGCGTNHRPAMTLDRKTEGFVSSRAEAANFVTDPANVLLFVLFLLLVCISYCIRTMWKLERKVADLRTTVTRLEGKVQ